MRIKRKKHLRERLDNVKDFILVAERDVSNVLEAVKDKRLIDLKSAFNNDNPVCLEIGCGKGGFVTQMAKINPDKNFIAVELLDNVIVMAVERANDEKLKNVKFINSGAEYLERYIPSNSIENIFLNFSPPYPQKSYENRRLTNDRYISEYSTLLKEDGVIYQKTDDKDFFEYSVSKFLENGYNVSVIDDDSDLDFVKCKTEYENKFLSLDMPIYRLIAKKRPN